MHEIYIRLAYTVWLRKLKQSGHFQAADRLEILESGCGPGFLLKYIEQWFPNAATVGLDINSQLIESASLETTKTAYVQASAQNIPISSQSFDLIVSLHVIEHLPDPKQFVMEAHRVLRPGGILLIATPNPESLGSRLLKEEWSGWKDETHISVNPPIFWNKLVQDCKFKILQEGTTGLSGIPIFRQFPLSLLNRGMLFLFGFFSWRYGEAYICIVTRT